MSARPTAEEERLRAAQVLAATVRDVFGQRIDTCVRAVLVEGPPAPVLLRYARGALLLALGRGAHGEPGPFSGRCRRPRVPAPRGGPRRRGARRHADAGDVPAGRRTHGRALRSRSRVATPAACHQPYTRAHPLRGLIVEEMS